MATYATAGQRQCLLYHEAQKKEGKGANIRNVSTYEVLLAVL